MLSGIWTKIMESGENNGVPSLQIAIQDAIDSSDVIGRWEWDIVNDRIFANDLVALLFNLDPIHTTDGAPLSLFLKGIHPDDRDRTVRVIESSARSGKSYVQEYRVLSADGVTRWVLARGLIVLDETGRPIRGTGLLIDISKTKSVDRDKSGLAVPDDENPLYRAAEACQDARRSLDELGDPILKLLCDMLLLEVGRKIAKSEFLQSQMQLH